MSNDLITVNYEDGQPTVLGRDLHAALGVGTAYKDWFPRMCEYGFVEGLDFNPLKNERVQMEGGRMVCRTVTDHQLTIPMAKEICMLQRNEKGRQFRQYFIQIEDAWNSPEAVMARALQFAERHLAKVRRDNEALLSTVAVQHQQITEMQPKASYYDVILQCPDLMPITTIAKDYGKSAKWMNKYLHERGIQFKQSGIWLLYQRYAENGYTSTKTHSYEDHAGRQHSKVQTYWTQKGRLFLYELLREDDILPQIEQ